MLKILSKKHKILLWIDRLARWALSLVFIYAVLSKLTDITQFANQIGAFGILPNAFILPAAIFILLAEMIIALGLLRNNYACKVAAGILLVLFITILVNAVWMGLEIDCGCFGPGDAEAQAFSRLRAAIVRDCAMLFLLIFSFWYQRYRSPKYHKQGASRV